MKNIFLLIFFIPLFLKAQSQPYDYISPKGVVITMPKYDSEAVRALIDAKQTALGFTPYNATNPNGYITSSNAASTYQPIGSYATTTQLGAKLNITDTSGMLSNYLRSTNAAAIYQPIGSYATTTQLSTKVNVTDTSSMLSNYLRSTNAAAIYQPIGSYATTTQLGAKVNITDTSSMLSNYLRSTNAAATYQPIGSYATTTQLGTKVNVTDTSSMLSNYLRSTNAAATYQPILSGGTALQLLRKNALNNGLEWATVAGTGDALTANPLSQFSATTSTQLANVLSDETGTGTSVFATNPNLSQIRVDNTATPATPAADKFNFYGDKLSNTTAPKFIDQHGVDNYLQTALYRNNLALWLPPGNANTVPGVLGLTAPTVVGTATTRSVATTNIATRKKRVGYVSAATAAALTEMRVAVAQYSAGTGTANDGSGFNYKTVFIPSNAAAVSGERFFIGLSNSVAAATNVEPNTLTNVIGVAQLSTDATQFYLVYGGSAAQTAIACGTGLGSPASLSTSAFELSIYAPQTIANTFYVQVTNLGTGATFTQTLTGAATVIPQSITLLAHKAWKTNNATLLAVAFDIASIYFENK